MTLLARAGHLSTIVLSKHSISPSRGCILSSEHVERRLVAILAADVAGSCRLIGIDEEGTLAQLRALRKTLIDPKIAEHHGRVVKNTGDGALVEFASVVDAVRCADEIQRSVAEQNTDVPQDNGSNFASAFTSVILSSQTMISLVMGSILQCVSKGSQSRVGFAFPTMLTGRFGARLRAP